MLSNRASPFGDFVLGDYWPVAFIGFDASGAAFEVGQPVGEVNATAIYPGFSILASRPRPADSIRLKVAENRGELLHR